MSPARSAREMRQRRMLWISVISVVVVTFGWMAAVVAAGWHPLLGLDLDGGLSVVYRPAHTATPTQLNEVVTIMTDRVDALGVSGANVSTQGGNVVVSVPGIQHPNAVLKLVGSTGQLFFRPALCYAPPFASPSTGKQSNSSSHAASSTTTTAKGTKAPSSTTSSSTTTSTSSTTTTTSPASVVGKPLPTSCPSSNQLVTANLTGTTSSSGGVSYANTQADASLADYRTTPPSQDAYAKTVLLPLLGGGGERMLLGPGELKGDIIKPGSAAATLTSSGQWVVTFSYTGNGWDTMAEKYFHEIIAMELDGVIQSAPITQPTQSAFSSFGGNVQISGSFTQQQADNLALVLNYGALPVRLDAQNVQTVSPTLGHASLTAGLWAGFVGLLLVLLYVIVYYRFLGLVVVSGLVVTGAALWAIISTLGVKQNLTLDLAGVTGLIVSIGITVDSYIVFFERLKDEARAGRSVRTSVDRGFRSAWRTVFNADMVSLLGAVVLWLLAVGSVRGFAFFLGLSTLLDLIITYFYTRPLVMLLSANERVTEAKLIGINQGLAVSGADA